MRGDVGLVTKLPSTGRMSLNLSAELIHDRLPLQIAAAIGAALIQACLAGTRSRGIVVDRSAVQCRA